MRVSDRISEGIYIQVSFRKGGVVKGKQGKLPEDFIVCTPTCLISTVGGKAGGPSTPIYTLHPVALDRSSL